jgi:release factor glutamine methyltransferase
MKVASNKIADIREYYSAQLKAVYAETESRFLVDSVISHYADIPRLEIPINLDRRVGESLLLKIHFAVKDLLRHRPLQYVLGEAEFCGLPFYVNEQVLIPRPETEQLIDLIIDSGSRLDEKTSILDLGTGSGCIAISLASQLNCKVSAVDISSEAIEIAKKNAVLNKVQVSFIKADLLSDNFENDLHNKYDVIVSNPPYVRNQEKQMMQKNVLDFEPELALFVEDENPLIYYEAICRIASSLLNNKGVLWLEINEYLAEETLQLAKRYFSTSILIKDYKGNYRFIQANQPI